MGSFSIWHWLLVFLIIVLIFGTKKLKHLGHDLGEAIRNFKESVTTPKTDTKTTDEK